MRGTNPVVRFRMGGVLALGMLACSTATDDAPTGMAAARAGTAAAGDPIVDAAVPPEAPQDTTLDVRVLGSNFDRGSSVDMLIDELPTTKVITNRTRFKNSGELIATITVAFDAPITKYDVLVTTSRGKKGIGIEKFAVTERIHPHLLPLTFELPIPFGPNGLFSDGGGSYLGTMDDEGGTVDAQAICADSRAFVIQLPAAWASQVATGTAQHCILPDGFSEHRLDLNRLGACPEGTSCPNGTTGHTSGTNFGPDLHYYWSVVQPKPKGKGTIVYTYNVIWVDGSYRVTRWAGGIANGTPCAWRVLGARAELWQSQPTLARVGGIENMALDVPLVRTDSACDP